MRRAERVCALALGVAVTLALALPPAASAQTSALESATRSAVAITSYGDRIGTGVIVADDRVLTVAHVVDAAAGTPTFIVVGDALMPYEVLAADRERDLALLRVPLPDDVTPVAWAEEGTLAHGEDVIAIGFPIGFTSVTLTKGVVSSVRQEYQGTTFIQTDAAINPGNSGGPLVDGEGRLVGINVAKVALVDVDAVGFSISADEAREFLRRVAPELVLRAAGPDTATQGPGAGGATREPRAGSSSAALLLVAVLAFASAGVAAVFVVRGRRARAALPVGEPAKGRPRAVFLVKSAAGDHEFDLRLPSVAGSARNADIHVPEGEIAAYQVRFSPVPGGVEALDLTDSHGMYCGNACVASAVLRPGESIRVGDVSIVLVRAYDA